MINKGICVILGLIILVIFLINPVFSQNITITDDESYTADSSAMLDVKSTSKGMLVPRMDSSQRVGIVDPATGLLVYDNDANAFFYFNGTSWLNLTTNVISPASASVNDALFSVVNTEGDTVFAVYPEGVRIRVGDGVGKGNKGGFAVGGLTSEGKADSTTNYFTVSPDSVRVYVDTVNAKGNKGGFAVGGLTSAGKAGTGKYFYVDEDTTAVSTILTASKNIVVGGDILDSEGGFYTSGDSVTDYDGNTYPIVTIGNQIWMAENLKTTHYADGTPLVDGASAGDITGDYSTKYYFWYNDDSSSYAETYGALYTWAAAMNGQDSSNTNPSEVQGVCPVGWHMPSSAEWTELINYLTNNGYGYGGSGSDIAKSLAVNNGWDENPTAGNVGNDQATNNSSGFSAKPSGDRDYYGSFVGLGYYSGFWSTTEYDNTESYNYYLRYDLSYMYYTNNKKNVGFSCRCIKD